MVREYQVEWMSRPDERKHIEIFDDFREAHRRAKSMSDQHDGYSVVIALDDMANGKSGKCATGHMDYMFGMRLKRIGSLSEADWPLVGSA